MTVNQKAKQLAKTLLGEDQNQKPLIEVLIDMARWERDQMMKNSVDGKIVDDGCEYQVIIPALPVILREFDDGDKVRVIVIKEE